MQVETKLVEGWCARSYRAGDLECCPESRINRLLPPVEEGGPQMHGGKVGEQGWGKQEDGKKESWSGKRGGRRGADVYSTSSAP